MHEEIRPLGRGDRAREVDFKVGLTGKKRMARLATGLALVAACGLTAGCMSSPTYGTDKTSNEQLVSDLSGMFSFSDKKKARIDYQPRPELVKPAKRDEALPLPQQSIATADNPSWPESPEQRLARIRANADANADDPNYRSPVVADRALEQKPTEIPSGNGHGEDSGIRSPSKMASEKAEFQKRLKENQQGDSAQRKYLSEPPTEYRQASADAPQGEIGEDEADKESRLKREARKKSGASGFRWEDLNPF
jgi:hypothetical protein